MSVLLPYRSRAIAAARVCLCLILVACFGHVGFASAADPSTPAPAAATPSAATPSAGSADATAIRALLPGLKERSTGADTVAKLAALRDERVLHLFERFREKSVYTLKSDGTVVYVPSIRDEGKPEKVADIYDLFAPVDAEGKLTGVPEKSISEKEIDEFTLPRPVRNAMLDALRVMGLQMDDPAIRKAAARDLGGRRQADALPDLKKLAESDPNPAVKDQAKESIDLILIGSPEAKPSPADKLAAIKDLGDRTSLRSLDMLKENAAKPDVTPDEKAAYDKAIGQINTHLTITNWIKNVFFGLSSGSIYVLLALGLAITFGLMGVINMAHGEMMMIGAVTTWACCEYIGKALPPAYFDWYYVAAFPLSFIVAASFGLLIEVSIVRWLSSVRSTACWRPSA